MADEEAGQGEVGIWDQAAQAAGEAWDSAAETAGGAWDAATDTAEQAWDTATDTAAQAWDTATEVAGQAWDTVTDTAAKVWNDVTDGNPGTPGPAVVDDHELVLPPSLEDLQRLAGNVPEAKGEWNRLGEGERTTLLDFMTSFWGAVFAQAFATTPADLNHDVDSIRNLSHDDVVSRGFQFSREEGNFWIYYHPSGRTFHLQVHWPDEEPPDGEPGEENFNQASNTALFLEWKQADLPRMLEEYLQHRGEPDQEERRQAANEANDQLNADIQAARAQFEHWRATVPSAGQAELEEFIERIEQVSEWHDGYGPDFTAQVNEFGWPDE